MAEPQGLYVIIDPSACRGRSVIDVTEAALAGGARMFQWRDKLRDKGDQLQDLLSIFSLCRRHDALLIVNDHADLALTLAHASNDPVNIGVHLGQHDLPVAGVRRYVPAVFCVGISTNNPDEAVAGQQDGASYIAVGDIFGTTSKQGTRAASPQRLAEVKAAVDLPVFGIGGINAGNVAEVIAAGADGIAVISAVCSAEDPEAATHELIAAIEAARHP